MRSQIDHDALRRSLDRYCGVNEERRTRIFDRLAAGEDWSRVARFCCFNVQSESLGLEIFQSPPCYADGDALREPYGDPRAARETVELAQRLVRAGLSKFEPDPFTALAIAEGHGA
jgi:hypothetical protein